MFTGIIEGTGKVKSVAKKEASESRLTRDEREGRGGVGPTFAKGKRGSDPPDAIAMQLEVISDFDLERTNLGESIAVNGCCLTITSRLGNTFWADLSLETMALTTLGDLEIGSAVNLERPLKMGERLGGHIVQGHVDGVGKVESVEDLGNSKKITIRAPVRLSRYLVAKGSIAVDGVSLTLNDCNRDCFSVMIIPHTQDKTTFQGLTAGSEVNLEVDIIGKYVEKLGFLDSEEYKKGTEVTKEFLKKHGF